MSILATSGIHGIHGTSGIHGIHGIHGSQGTQGGGASPAIAEALGQTAEAIMGFWDGQVPLPAARPRDHLDRLMRLDAYPRASVLAYEGMSLFSVQPGAGTAKLVRTGKDLVSLTPPTPKTIKNQMPELRAAMDLRADRLGEILAQSDGFTAFFAAQMPFGLFRRPYTLNLLTALYDTVVAQEQRIKHLCSVPRPVDLSPQVQPVITTPGHSAYPSGHATEAFAVATLFAAFRLHADGVPAKKLVSSLQKRLLEASETASEMDPVILLFRLAARIADNRTVAGVHYPLDSAHGGLLGHALALAFIAHCLGGGAANAVPAWTADANDWSGDFTLRKWCTAVSGKGETGWQSGKTTVAKARDWHVLPGLWKAALEEWT